MESPHIRGCKQNNDDRRLPRPRTVERCETYLDRLSDLIANAGKDWLVYRPLIERLEREAREAREEITLHERMLGRKRRDSARELTSPLPRMVRCVSPTDPRALTLARLWEKTAPHDVALSANDKGALIMLCRNRNIAAVHQRGMAIAFVR